MAFNRARQVLVAGLVRQVKRGSLGFFSGGDSRISHRFIRATPDIRVPSSAFFHHQAFAFRNILPEIYQQLELDCHEQELLQSVMGQTMKVLRPVDAEKYVKAMGMSLQMSNPALKFPVTVDSVEAHLRAQEVEYEELLAKASELESGSERREFFHQVEYLALAKDSSQKLLVLLQHKLDPESLQARLEQVEMGKVQDERLRFSLKS